jgi:hypothetical protein
VFKRDRNTNKRQILLLEEEGVLIASCNSIFDTEKFLNRSILDYFPLIESVFPVIRKLQLKDPEVRFASVKTNFKNLPGIYDFTFVRMKGSFKDYILWVVQDHTEDYKAKLTIQQLQNEKEIARELLKRS